MPEFQLPGGTNGRFVIVPATAVDNSDATHGVSILLDTASGASWFLDYENANQINWKLCTINQAGRAAHEDSQWTTPA